jgi:hypothetical protein
MPGRCCFSIHTEHVEEASGASYNAGGAAASKAMVKLSMCMSFWCRDRAGGALVQEIGGAPGDLLPEAPSSAQRIGAVLISGF